MTFLLPLTDYITASSSKSVKNRVLEAQYGNGYRQVANDGINYTIDQWKLQFAPLEGDNLTQLNSFIDTVGVVDWFVWTPLGETTAKNWRIDPDSIDRSMINTSKFIISFSVTQTFIPTPEFTTEFTSEYW